MEPRHFPSYHEESNKKGRQSQREIKVERRHERQCIARERMRNADAEEEEKGREMKMGKKMER